MKVLVLTADLGGNVPPTLAVADALERRGIQVEVAGLVVGRTAHTQVAFAAATAIAPEGRRRGPRDLGALRRLLLGRSTSMAVEGLIAERRPDVVVADCMVLASLRGALTSGVPTVVLFHTLGAYWLESFGAGPAGAFFGALGLAPRRLWERAGARLLLTDSELDPGRNAPAAAGYTWVGTTETGVAPTSRGAVPRILVSLSSTEWPGMLSEYRRIAAALAELSVEATVTTGRVDLGGDIVGAANVDVRGWISHDEVLPGVDLVIGHGGHSTTMKALAHGVPLLVLPINPTADQRIIGETLQNSGNGRWLAKSATPAAIGATVELMLADDQLAARAAATGHRLRSTRSGAEEAADQIIAVLEE